MATHTPNSWPRKAVATAPGDLMAIRSKFSVKLADYEVSHPVIGKKVAETVSLDVSLYLSTLPPERQ